MATAATRYRALQKPRESVLRQAREAARLTIPGLIPEEGATDPHDISEQPWSSFGARAVNNVGAKILLSLFPPNRPFIRLDVDPDTANALGQGLGKAQEALAGISRAAMAVAEASGSRPHWMEAFRHLIVAGNVLVYHPDDGSVMRLWRLDQYVVRRNRKGELIEAIIEEEIYPSELDEETRNAVGLNDANEAMPSDDGKPSDKEEEKVKVYTVIERVKDDLIHYQEINDKEVPQSRGSAKAVEAGWQALRWQAVPGSDYGRSFVSEYAGDFLSMEEGWKAIIKFAAEAARIIRVVDPNAAIDAEELAKAETGDHLTGFVDKIQTLQLEKSADFNVLWSVMENVERRLSQAFLLTSNTIRDAERVTTEEIRAVAQELEDSFGGTYTIMSAEVQMPYARRLLLIASKLKKAPKLPASVTPVVVTGFAALGSNHEVQALMDWVGSLVQLLGKEWVTASLKGDEFALRTGTGRGIEDVIGLLKTQEEKDAEQQNAMNSQMALNATQPAVKGVMDVAANAMQGDPQSGQ